MQPKTLKKTWAFLLTLVFTLCFSLLSYAESVTGENFFGYNTSVKTASGNEDLYGIIMWGALGGLVFILICIGIYNVIRLKKEEKERKAMEKPRLIIKKGYKN